MPRKARLPQSPRHILVYDEDWEWLGALVGPNGLHRHMTVSQVIREIIHKKVAQMRQQMVDRADSARDMKDVQYAE